MMIGLLKNLFEKHLDPNSLADKQQRLKASELAGAALMFELMESDHELDARETAEFVQVLAATFELQPEDVDEIVTLARENARNSTSLYEFTRLINDYYSYQDKVILVENLWRIAFADERLDKYEEGLIRRIAELIHVSHADFIQTKLKVRGNSLPTD